MSFTSKILQKYAMLLFFAFVYTLQRKKPVILGETSREKPPIGIFATFSRETFRKRTFLAFKVRFSRPCDLHPSDKEREVLRRIRVHWIIHRKIDVSLWYLYKLSNKSQNVLRTKMATIIKPKFDTNFIFEFFGRNKRLDDEISLPTDATTIHEAFTTRLVSIGTL